MNDNLLTREYDIPESVVTAEHTTVAINNVRVGDERDGRKVRTIKTGPKNTELLDEHAKRIDYLANGNGILITRYSETEDSYRAIARARRNRQLQNELGTRTASLDYAREKLDAQLDRDGFADYGVIQNLMVAQAELKLLHQLAGAATGSRYADLVAVEAALIEQLTSRMLEDFRHRALSRSTSVVSNLLEDVDREAAAKFIDRTRYMDF